MKIPLKLKIGASVWKVRFVDSLLDTDKGEEGRSLYGSASFADEVITLARQYNGKDISETAMADTFLHEVIHCCSSTFGIALTEQQVIGLAGAMLPVIRDSSIDFRK
jgi:hypothetical protein